MMRQALFAAVSLSFICATAASGLYGFAIVQLADDDHEQATTIVIDPDTGKTTPNKNFFFQATDQSSLDCFVGYSATNGSYIISSGPTPDIFTVDVVTGTLLSNVPMKPGRDNIPWFISAWSWLDGSTAGSGRLMLAVANNTGVYLAWANASTGDVEIANPHVLPYPYLIPCEAKLYPTKGWLLLTSTDVQRDDVDDTWSIVDVTAQPPAVVHTIPWAATKNGRSNGYTFLPADAGTDLILAWGKLDDGSLGPSLWSVDPDGSNSTVTELHQLPGKYQNTVITLNCVTVRTLTSGSTYRLYSLARDMGSQVQQLITVDIQLATAGRQDEQQKERDGMGFVRLSSGATVTVLNVTVTRVDDTNVGGDVYGLTWVQ